MPAAASLSLVLNNWRGVGGETEALRPGVGCLPSATSPPVPALSPAVPPRASPPRDPNPGTQPSVVQARILDPKGLGGAQGGRMKDAAPPQGPQLCPVPGGDARVTEWLCTTCK